MMEDVSKRDQAAEGSAEPVKAFAKIFSGLAIILCVIALIVAVSNLAAWNNASIVTGTVTGFDVTQNAIPFTGEDRGLQYYPVIQYEDGSQERAEFISPQPTRGYEVGEEVELRLSRGGRVFVSNFWGQWGAAIVLGGTALIFAISALAVIRLGKSATKP